MLPSQALVLSKYLDNRAAFPEGYFRGKRVIELGTGTGLVAMVVALLGTLFVPYYSDPI
jgi:predicted nicotinamide N-methyase